MPRYVALFRGINVGKAKRIAMADLRILLTGLGFDGVATLLNSGNAVFAAPRASDARRAERIRAAVLESQGFDAQVLVKSASEFDAIVDGNAIAGVASDPSRLLVALVQDPALLDAARKLGPADLGADTLHVGQYAAYLWCANGILESRGLESLIRCLGGRCTTRNWSTILKIQALLAEPGPRW